MSGKVLTRVIGAPLLLAALAGIVYFDWRQGRPLAVTVLLGAFAVASYRELCAMGTLQGLKPARELGSLMLMLAFGSQLWLVLKGWAPADIPTVVLAWTVGLLVMLVVRHGRFSPVDAGFSMLAFMYVALLLYVVWTLESLKQPATQMLYLAFLVAANKGSDMAAYGFGKLFGRHKLAPVVSPNKTWEGAIGGLVVGAGAGAIIIERTELRTLFASVEGGRMVPAPVWAIVLFACTVTIAAQFGDLVKSAIKRWAGVKDSGRLLPEFGGALDMCDSFILSAPVAWVGLRCFA